jgi:hypothetical protein
LFDLLLALGVSAFMVLAASVALPNALPPRIRPGSWGFPVAVVAAALIMLAVRFLLSPDRG